MREAVIFRVVGVDIGDVGIGTFKFLQGSDQFEEEWSQLVNLETHPCEYPKLFDVLLQVL